MCNVQYAQSNKCLTFGITSILNWRSRLRRRFGVQISSLRSVTSSISFSSSGGRSLIVILKKKEGTNIEKNLENQLFKTYLGPHSQSMSFTKMLPPRRLSLSARGICNSKLELWKLLKEKNTYWFSRTFMSSSQRLKSLKLKVDHRPP